MNLFPYQTEGAAFLAEKGRALLADEPGLGKTAQALVALKQLDVPYFLVICPASVVENWKREIRRWWPEATGWNVISYDRYARDHGKIDWLGQGADSAVVLDEAHYLKNPKAKRTRAIFGKSCDGKGGLVESAAHVFLLTGTPMPNNPSELWPMLRAVMPDAILGAKTGKPLAYWPFTLRYCKTADNGFGLQIVGGRNLAELKERIAPFYLRRKKAEVLAELPPLRVDVLPLEAKAPEVGDHLVRQALAEHGIEGLAKIAPHVATLRRLTGLAKVAPVVEWVKDQLDGGVEKIVLMAQHREVIDALGQAMVDCFSRNSVAVLHGGLSAGGRQMAIDAFQNDPRCRVFIGQIQAAGTGITLTAASDLLFVESSWVPAENEQAMMRIHRIGQRNACSVRFAAIAGSIDEDIAAACARKLETIGAVFG